MNSLDEVRRIGEITDKLLNDATYGIQTHFNAQQEQIDALKRQVDVQSRVLKEIWKKVKDLEGKG
jgi:diaminopimelate decarboxylase